MTLAFVKHFQLNTPPGSPSVRDLYVVGDAPTGDWAGQGGKFAELETDDGSDYWYFSTVPEGMQIWDNNLGVVREQRAQGWCIPDPGGFRSDLGEFWMGKYHGTKDTANKVYCQMNDVGTLSASGTLATPANVNWTHGIGIDYSKPVFLWTAMVNDTGDVINASGNWIDCDLQSSEHMIVEVFSDSAGGGRLKTRVNFDASAINLWAKLEYCKT